MLTLLFTALAAKPVPKNPDLEPLPVIEAAKGTVLFDVRIPAEVRVDGTTQGQLYVAGRLTVDVPIGTHVVEVVTNGSPRDLAVDVTSTGKTVVLVGKNGLTATHLATSLDTLEGEVPVELRVAGSGSVWVTLDEERYQINGHGRKAIVLPMGMHEMSVRSGDGHVLWARGRMELTQPETTIVQLSEGRLPEVSGPGAYFHPGR